MAKRKKKHKARSSHPADKKIKMKDILSELQSKLKEVDELRKELDEVRMNKISVHQAKTMLEEIKVPSLDLITDRDKKKPHAHAG